MASQTSLEKEVSRSSKREITISWIGLGHQIKKSIGFEFLQNFIQDEWYQWNKSGKPPIRILINNRDSKIEYVKTYIEELIEIAEGLRNKRPDLENMIRNNVKAARVELIAKESDIISIAYDSGINEPEINAASRFLVQNPNLATMLGLTPGSRIKVTGEVEELPMVDVLGKSKAMKFMITNCVDYMIYFSQRHLMKEYVKGDPELFKSVAKLSKKDKAWEYNDKLIGISGKYLVKALQKYDDQSREYLKFLAKSWFGFSQVDVSRLASKVEALIDTEGLSRADYMLEGLFYYGEHGKFGAPALSSLRVNIFNEELRAEHPELEFPFKEGGIFFNYRKYPQEIIPKEDKISPLDSLPVAIGAHVPNMFNAKGFWPFKVLHPPLLKVLMAMLHRLGGLKVEQDQEIFGSQMHLNDEDSPAIITLPAEFELYDHDSKIALGTKLNKRFAGDNGRFNQAAESESGATVFDKRDRNIFGKNMRAIYNTIEVGEKSEFEEPNLGIAYINPIDVLVAVQDSQNEGVVLTAFNGSNIPAGRIIPRIFPGKEDSEKYVTPFQDIRQIAGQLHVIDKKENKYSRNLVLLARNSRNTKYRLVRIRLLNDFTPKESYNLKAASDIKKGQEIFLEHEKMSYCIDDVEDTVETISVKNGKIYILHRDHIEIRDLETLAVESKKGVTDRIRFAEDLKVDSRGNIFVSGTHPEISDKIMVFDENLNFCSTIDFNGQIFAQTKIQEYSPRGSERSQYLFYSIPGNSKVFCKNISDISTPEDISLEMDTPPGRGLFAPGIYTNPETKEELLYITRIVKDESGQSVLKVEFYCKGEAGELKKRDSATFGDELSSSNKLFDIKTCDNYIIIGNRSYLVGKHTQNNNIAKNWRRKVNTGKFKSLIDYEIIPLEVKPNGKVPNIG